MSELSNLVREWAKVLDIPSGAFVNEDLERVASVLEAQEARIEELEKALKSADFIMSRWACIADSTEVVIPHDMLDLTTDCIEAVRAAIDNPDYRMEGRENEHHT